MRVAQAADFGLEQTAKEIGFKTETTLGPAAYVGTIVGYALAFIGVLFFLLMLWGGLQWMLARGNSEKVDKAKDLIVDAVLGIVIIFISYVVTRFVVQTLTGVAQL